jgi:membrane protease YdiL (CAAX protease family)
MSEVPPGPGQPGLPPPTEHFGRIEPSAPTAPVGTAVPAGTPYHLVHRAGRSGGWRPAVGTVALVALMLVVVPLLWQLPFALGFALAGRPVVPGMERLLDLTDPTPGGLAYLNLVLASAIPVTWLLTRVLHGLRPRWLASIGPRIRWQWFLVCLGLSVVALFATLFVAAFVPQGSEGVEMSGRLNDFDSTARDFLLVLLLLTPLQAAGEEYVFRGYLLQALGSQSAPVFFDRFAFGVVAGILVIVTGGLEAGIAMHVLNNWLAFGIALAFGDMASTLNPTGGSWWSIPVTLTQSLAYLGLVLLVARRLRLGTVAEPAVLVAPSGRV